MKRLTAVVIAVAAAFASLVLPATVSSQVPTYVCVGPYSGCTPGCCNSASGCFGTCVDSIGNIRNFQSEKNVDMGQYGCIYDDSSTCNETMNVMVCQQTYYGLDYCAAGTAVCSGFVFGSSCNR